MPKRDEEEALDAVTEQELTGASTASPAKDTATSRPPKNACASAAAYSPPPRQLTPPSQVSELMNAKPISPPPSKKPRLKPASEPNPNPPQGRDALIAYITHPESFPPSRVVYHTADFVAIHDLFPKSDVHMLLLPRNLRISLTHPFDALADPPFLETVRREVATIKSALAAELRRRHGRFSAQDAPRNAALDSPNPPATLPPGRDWSAEIRAGVHAHPSMTHLHVHVLSRDRHSACLKHRKHYNSFSTPFFVPLEDFPLAEQDSRRHPGRQGYLDADFECWRCGMGFGNKFKRLKEHLDAEFEAWRRE